MWSAEINSITLPIILWEEGLPPLVSLATQEDHVAVIILNGFSQNLEVGDWNERSDLSGTWCILAFISTDTHLFRFCKPSACSHSYVLP